MSSKVLWLVAICFVVSCSGAKPDGIVPLINRPLPPKLDQDSTTFAIIKAPLVDTPLPEDENSFAPGTIISGIVSSPLNKFRDTVLNRIIPAIKRPFNRQSDTTMETTTPTANTYVTDCTEYSGLHCSDCNTVVLCNKEMVPMFTSKCTSSAKYCTQSGCSDTTTDETCSSATTFTCTAEGYFPDPHNCSIYYYCPSATAAAESILTYECPANFHYNSRTRNCQRQLLMLPRCQTMDCTGMKNEFILYSQNNGYFAYCSEDANQQAAITMFKCPDADNQVYNRAKLGCEYKCRKEGFFADTLDCKSYYFCYRDRLNGLKNIHETCPDTYQFQDGKCVKSATECVNPARR